MKFDDKYPDAVYLDVPGKGPVLKVKQGQARKCWHCGELTTWVEIDFETPLCSEECFEIKWNEYKKSL